MIKLGRAFQNTIAIEIDGAFFVCEFVRSPNRRFMLAWADNARREEGQTEDDTRPLGRGPFVLLDDDCAVLSGELDRPHDGLVANNGTFLLADKPFGDNAGSGLIAYNGEGQKLLDVRLGAPIGDSGLAANGCFAACQLMESDTEASNKLNCFDLTTGKLLWAREIESGTQRKRYKFDPVLQELHITYFDGIGPLSYDLTTGEFLGRDDWRRQRLRRADPQDSCALAEEEIAALPAITDLNERGARGKELFDLLRRAFENCESPPQRAAICTTLGHFYEAFSLSEQAQQAYERAISLQPDDASVHQHLGAFFERRHQPDFALAAYERALALNPESDCRERLDALRSEGVE